MLLQEQEEHWLQDSKEFWRIITSRDKPSHLRYTGAFVGSRARKYNSKKPLPTGEDVYMSLLPLDKVGKSSNNISCFNMLWVDLDFKDCFTALDSGAEYKLKNLKDPPNIIVFSGKGLWALWFIEPVNKNEWLILQRNLAKEIKTKFKIKSMYVDTKVIEPLKFIRLPGGINSKSGQRVAFKILNLEVKNIILSRNVALYREGGNGGTSSDGIISSITTSLEGISKKITNRKKESKNNRVTTLETLYNLNLTRVGDLDKILAYGYIGKGNRNEYLHIYSCQLVAMNHERTDIVDRLTDIIRGQGWRIGLAEIRGIVNSAVKHKYKYKNDTIIRKLGLDIEIQAKLITIKDSNEEVRAEIKKRKDRETKRASRRNENGLTTREQKNKDTIKSIQGLKAKGIVNKKEISRQLNISLKTVYRYWNIS